MQGCRHNTGFVGCGQDNSTGSIAKQDTGRPVVIVDNAGIGFSTNDQNLFIDTCPDKTVRDGQCIQETAANCLHVESGTIAGNAQFFLDHTGRARETAKKIRGGRRQNNHVDIVSLAFCHFKRFFSCLDPQITALNAFIGIMARQNSASGSDPFVRGLDPLFGQYCGQFVICNPFWR